MKRRQFLNVLLPLLVSTPLCAEYLKGASPATGQRELAVWRAALALASLRLGKPGDQTQIIFFLDANCPACAKLWNWFDTTPRRELASVWVPVSYMSKTSASRGVSLLRAPDPYFALAHNFRGFDHANRQGGIAPVTDSTMAELSKIERNTRFWYKRLFEATPLILYRAQNGIWQTLGWSSNAEMDQLVAKLSPSGLEPYKTR